MATRRGVFSTPVGSSMRAKKNSLAKATSLRRRASATRLRSHSSARKLYRTALLKRPDLPVRPSIHFPSRAGASTARLDGTLRLIQSAAWTRLATSGSRYPLASVTKPPVAGGHVKSYKENDAPDDKATA